MLSNRITSYNVCYTKLLRSLTGDYRQSGELMDKIYYSLLNDYKIETYKGYGKYFDNPKKTEKSNLRSEAGCVVETADLGKITERNNFV